MPRPAVGSLIWSDSTLYGIIVYTGICGKRDDLHWMCSHLFTPIHNFGQNTPLLLRSLLYKLLKYQVDTYIGSLDIGVHFRLLPSLPYHNQESRPNQDSDQRVLDLCKPVPALQPNTHRWKADSTSKCNTKTSIHRPRFRSVQSWIGTPIRMLPSSSDTPDSQFRTTWPPTTHRKHYRSEFRTTWPLAAKAWKHYGSQLHSSSPNAVNSKVSSILCVVHSLMVVRCYRMESDKHCHHKCDKHYGGEYRNGDTPCS